MNAVKPPAAARKKPLSDPMIAMLRSASAGLPLTTGLRGRSEHGGAVWTEMALKKRGLLDRAGSKLTADGYGSWPSGARKIMAHDWEGYTPPGASPGARLNNLEREDG